MKHTYSLLFSFLGSLAICLSSCELYNPAEPVPGYLHIDKINLSTDAATQGSNSSKMTDAWIYIDDQLLGCFELPATVPVIAEGSHNVKVRGGIKINGIAANRSPYPFFNSYSQQVNFEPGKRITLTPTVTYHSIADFAFIEDCESAGAYFDTTNSSSTGLSYITSPPESVFEGSKSLLAYAQPSGGNNFVEFATALNYDLPKGGAPVFLEFNYNSNYEFTVSIIAYGTSSLLESPVLHFNPSNGWNKTYTYLTPVVSAAYSAIDYKIQFGMLNQSADSAYLLLDNIKLVY